MTPFERTCWFFNEIYLSLKPSPVLKYLDQIQTIVQPGDVIAIRSHYFDRVVPGYWTHVGIYAGEVSGRQHQVVQTRLYGTHPIDLQLFLRAGWAAILRPKLSTEERISAVENAKSCIGKKHYDLHFDFSDDTELVCSELIYVLYKDKLSLETYNVRSFLGEKKAFLPDHMFMKGFDTVWISPGAEIPSNTLN
jgi:hypothetical protein